VTSVPTPETFTITFNEDGSFNALADCNRVNGTFTADDPQLEIVVGMSTMAFCPNQELADQFTQELGDVTSYVIEDGHLFLTTKFASDIMEFQPAEEVTLVGPTWQWVETLSMDGSVTSVPTPETFTITFNEDGTYNALADCNRVNGGYTVDGSQLEIMPGMSTMAFCPNQELADQFTQELGGVASYLIEDGSLFLAIKFDSGIMEFRPAPEVTEVTGIYWGWHRFQSGDGSEFSADPALYQIFLNEDGTFNWRADCNSGSGTYTMDGQSIGFEIGASTLAMCPPESQSEAFLQYLRDTATFVMAEGDLVLNLKFDSGNLYFTRAG
jgi:heat shock protein HslJ